MGFGRCGSSLQTFGISPRRRRRELSKLKSELQYVIDWPRIGQASRATSLHLVPTSPAFAVMMFSGVWIIRPYFTALKHLKPRKQSPMISLTLSFFKNPIDYTTVMVCRLSDSTVADETSLMACYPNLHD